MSFLLLFRANSISIKRKLLWCDVIEHVIRTLYMSNCNLQLIIKYVLEIMDVLLFYIKTLLLSRCILFVLFFFRKNFGGPPELLLGVSDRPYEKGFCFFFPLSQNSSMVYFFDLADNIRCSLNFLPNRFLSCCWSRTTSSLNISFDCSGAQLNAERMLYLLY